MVKRLILENLQASLQNLKFEARDINLTITESSKFGDYTTNIALQLANHTPKKPYHSPKDIAKAILQEFGHPAYLERVEVAGAGFINFFIKDEYLIKGERERVKGKGEKILIEYGHVNPLKEIHLGHLRTFILGESLARILEFLGCEVFRANYQGDIGLHIAKAIWGIKEQGGLPALINLEKKAQFLGQSYALGNTMYEKSASVKQEIDNVNKSLYEKEAKLIELYDEARGWSLEYFEPIYQKLGIKYDQLFFESEVYEVGKKIVLLNTGKVFEEDNGAIIYPGEKFGLHNRVFITSSGNPTYEGKEIGLAKKEYESFKYDESIHVVANEQKGYFQVVFKAIEQVFPYLKNKKYHLSYGFVDLKKGKMSSRTGEVKTFDWLFDEVRLKIKNQISLYKQTKGQVLETVAMGAIKFSYLKFAPSTDISFDIEQSISLQGDSGPYLQYSFARTHSLLENAATLGHKIDDLKITEVKLEEEEREVLRNLEYFESFVEQAAKEYKPNLICEYLLSLAKSFNLFYQKWPILKSQKADLRLYITKKVGQTLKQGLDLLGIESPEGM